MGVGVNMAILLPGKPIILDHLNTQKQCNRGAITKQTRKVHEWM